MNEKPRCLLVDDEPNILKTIQMVFSLMNPPLECITVSSIQDAYAQLINSEVFDLCITDFKFPDGKSGMELVKFISQHYPYTKVALMTAFGSEEIQVEALKMGAFDYLTKPLNLVYLRNTILNALNVTKKSDIKIVGSSKEMENLRILVAKYGQTQAPIYISGESGSGKELVARSIHEQSPRKDKPFIAVNCGAIPPDLMESELFGHKKGSFTNAYADKEGLFKVANGGTLLLDEVADLPMNMQVKLLRVLQEREIRPIGGTKDISIDVRIISATNANLEQLIEENKFRKDLFYRLNVLNINIPPLREHLEDIPELAEQLIKRLTSKRFKLSNRTIAVLKNYEFPGNIRELGNILERAIVLCEQEIIEEHHIQLPQNISNNKIKPLLSSVISSETQINERLQSEREQIIDALVQTRGKIKAAAKLLNFSFESMRYRMRKYNVDKNAILKQLD